MKRVLLVLVLLVFVLMFGGTMEKTVLGNQDVDAELSNLAYSITVVYKNRPVAYASVICILSSGNEVFLECDKNGNTEIETLEPIIKICGVARGLAGVTTVEEAGEVKVSVKKVKQLSRSLAKAARAGTFAVYETDGNGDVKFKYLGTVNRYYCSSHLPILGFGKNYPYPSNWDKEDVSYPSPWKGKKLYVPRRYQLYHERVYGYSISRALFLVADY